MKTDTWNNMYPSNWKGIIVEDAIVHPAKFSSKLIAHIYEHLLEEGWVQTGDVVIDPFGGVALGALDAMRNGLRWRGCELEEKFEILGQGMDCPGVTKKFWRQFQGRGSKWIDLRVCPECAKVLDDPGAPIEFMRTVLRPVPEIQPHRYLGNIESWQTLLQSGDAHLYRGDSRNLVEVLNGTGEAVVSSPPYAESIKDERTSGIDWSKLSDGGKKRTESRERYGAGYGETPGQLGAMKSSDEGFQASISSPPFLQSEGGTPEPKEGGSIDEALYRRHAAGNSAAKGYGESDGNLGNLRGSEEGFRASIGSPAYGNIGVDKNSSRSIDIQKQYESYKKSGGGQTLEQFKATQEKHSHGYGESAGQLSAMPVKDESFRASISSPPYESTRVVDTKTQNGDISSIPEFIDTYGSGSTRRNQESIDDFWLAARQIVEQVYILLQPGGHAIWVVKDFVKNKERVPFCDQWRKMCEAVGFVTLHEHHASLVHHKGTQLTLDGGEFEIKTESKSFFRRLAEKKGSPRIDWETVFCMEKPYEG